MKIVICILVFTAISLAQKVPAKKYLPAKPGGISSKSSVEDAPAPSPVEIPKEESKKEISPKSSIGAETHAAAEPLEPKISDSQPEPEPAHEKAADGYRYRTVKRYRYRYRL